MGKDVEESEHSIRASQQVQNELINEMKEYDIIHLQELNSWVIGIFGYIFYKYLEEYFYNFPILMMIIDILSIIEGIFIHYSVYDNVSDVCNIATNNNFNVIKSISKNYVMCGLVSFYSKRFNIIKQNEYKIPTDIIHSPHMLETILEIDKHNVIRCINLHLVPTLPNTTLCYKFVNILNYIIGYNTYNIREKTYDIITNILNLDKIKHIVMAGDFNEKHNQTNYQLLHNFAVNNKLNIIQPDNTEYSTINNANEIQIIDYILTNMKYTNIKVNKNILYSDHNAIESILSIN